MAEPSEYDYTVAGFDKFLDRSIDNGGQQQTLNHAPATPSTAVAYDRSQVSGAVGDTIRVGNIEIDGVRGRISIYDGSNEVVRIGELDD